MTARVGWPWERKREARVLAALTRRAGLRGSAIDFSSKEFPCTLWVAVKIPEILSRITPGYLKMN